MAQHLTSSGRKQCDGPGKKNKSDQYHLNFFTVSPSSTFLLLPGTKKKMANTPDSALIQRRHCVVAAREAKSSPTGQVVKEGKLLISPTQRFRSVGLRRVKISPERSSNLTSNFIWSPRLSNLQEFSFF